ncbi:MAG: patatin-like phospholipase family protein, partial [Proteobacteria bacterium]|nr:patatin-like phospholipase family protein [Pseudomonadota bacterium]
MHSNQEISLHSPYRPGENKTKTALVLAGGGLAGAVYEIGALRAIDELLVDRAVGDFDIVVGTSAGALVGSMLAQGISPGEMMQTLDGSHPEINRIQPNHLFNLNTREFAKKGWRLPITLKNAFSHYIRNRSDMNALDFLWSMIEALPSGLYDNHSLSEFL